MLVIGSRALVHHFPNLDRVPNDWDFICTFEEFQKWSKVNKSTIQHCVPLSGDKFHVRDEAGTNFEFEIAWPGSSGEWLLMYAMGKGIGCVDVYATPATLLALKLSHKYLKDSPHFLKTMRDIQLLRGLGVELTYLLEDWLPHRELETYTYKHPKLDVTKGEFFAGDGVQYVYDHDSLHMTVALTPDRQGSMVPAYTFYADGAVWSSKELFFKVPEQIRLYGVYEEACVLALERSQIPYPNTTPRKSFEMALMKVATSITSGWFREWAYNHHDDVMALYEQLGEDDYLQRFKRNAHMLKPHTVEMM